VFIDSNVNLTEIMCVTSQFKTTQTILKQRMNLSPCIGGIEARDHGANDAFVYLDA
jgi:hypothetical protein